MTCLELSPKVIVAIDVKLVLRRLETAAPWPSAIHFQQYIQMAQPKEGRFPTAQIFGDGTRYALIKEQALYQLKNRICGLHVGLPVLLGNVVFSFADVINGRSQTFSQR